MSPIIDCLLIIFIDIRNTDSALPSRPAPAEDLGVEPGDLYFNSPPHDAHADVWEFLE